VTRYEFACDRCGQRRDVERPMAQADLPAYCPVCDAPMRRLFGPYHRPESYGKDGFRARTDPLDQPVYNANHEHKLREIVGNRRVQFGRGGQPPTGGV
jgi:putative FmdB family regulatory protein